MNPQVQPVQSGPSLAASSFELRHLRYFLAVVEDLNFTRAARKLNVVQQTLSEGIAQLEDIVGLRLFERATRPVRLTDAAVRWLPPPFGGYPTRGRHSKPPCAPTTRHGACVPGTRPG
jgi:Bacterial regulatory helix-turn-helix protein, lysR family